MATITDVAEKAGVSIKTVSRVMNNQQPVADRTREKVLKVMRDLDFKPSAAAQQLRSGRSPLIGIVYTDPSSGYQARFNHAMLQASNVTGRYVVSGLFGASEGDWLDQLKAFVARTKVSKLVLVPPLSDSLDLQDYVRAEGIDTVLVSPARVADHMRLVAMDDRMAARDVTEYLIDLGHRRIGHIMGDALHMASVMRRQGFEEGFVRKGLVLPGDDLIAVGNFDFQDALEAAEHLLTQDDIPTAIFAGNDEMAAAVYVVAGRLGLTIPTDLSVVGFDDTRLAQTIWPRLSTVEQPFEAMAQAAIEGVDADAGSWRKLEADARALPYKLKVRESCAPTASRG